MSAATRQGKIPGTGMYTSLVELPNRPPGTHLRWSKLPFGQSQSLSCTEGSNTSGPICEEPFVPADYIEEYWDDVNGGLLPAEEVKKARTLEMDYFKKQGVYRKVPVTQCYTEGLRPITVRWLETNKGDPEKPNYRSRLVAREIKAAKKPEDQLPQNLLFSSTPPLEAMRYLLSAWATDRVSAKGRRLKLGLWDISRAHFYGVPKRRIYVELPPEDAEEGFCGLLEKSMYGCQDAPAIWQDHYTQLLLKHGFQRGRSNGSCFYKPSTGCRVLVHGDDFLALGDQEALDELDSTLRSAYELKRLGMLGDEDGDDRAAHFLNRLIRIRMHEGQSAVFLEPDRRHVEVLVRHLGMVNAKGTETPDIKKSVEQQLLEANSPPLAREAASLYRSSVMRAAYLSQDRPDLSHAVKNLSRKMVTPTEAAMQDLKRLCRYLLKYPDLCQVFGRQAKPSKVRIQVDSDHAGDAVYLWLQERVAMNHLKVEHIPGKRNRSDVLTKSVPGVQMKDTMNRSGFVLLQIKSKGQMSLLDS